MRGLPARVRRWPARRSFLLDGVPQIEVGGMIPADAHRFHFDAMTREQQIAAIRRLHEQGYTDDTIAHATGLSREFVRMVLAQ